MESEAQIEEPKGMRVVSGASFLFALLQSLCTAVLTISGIRVAIGLSALAAASGIYAPARGFHQDAIRIPMLIVAGTIEGFVSPTDIPAKLKYMLAATMFGVLLLFVMRKSSRVVASQSLVASLHAEAAGAPVGNPT